MAVPHLPVVALAMSFLVCCWTEKADERITKRVVVVSNTIKPGPSNGKLELRDADCPTSTFTITPRSRSRDHDPDTRCVQQLVADATMDYTRRRMKQGCMPGKVYWRFVGDCEMKDYDVIESGQSCKP